MLGNFLRRSRPPGARGFGRPAQHQRITLNRHFRVPFEPDLCKQRLRDHDSV